MLTVTDTSATYVVDTFTLTVNETHMRDDRGAPRYQYEVQSNGETIETGSDLSGWDGVTGALFALVSFLQSDGEKYAATMGAREPYEPYTTSQDVGEWAYLNSDELGYVAIELDPDSYGEGTEYIAEHVAEERYEETLNELHGVVEIAGLRFDTGRALRELDPIAFREGMLNWLDSEGIEIV